jgi:hypothetical protein
VRNQIYREVFNRTWIKRNMPANRLQLITWAALALIVLAVAAALLFSYQQRLETVTLLRGKYLDDIEAGEVGAQMYHLGQLCGIGQEEAQGLFFAQMYQQQQRLFDTAAYTTTTSEQLATVFDCLYPAIDSQVRNPKYRVQLSNAMCRALRNLEVAAEERREQICAADGRAP